MEFVRNLNSITYTENGKLLAEVTFPSVSDNVVDINHTFVDDSLRGMGVASKLMEEAYKAIKETDRKAVLTCTYAVSWYEKHPENKDILK